MRLDRLFHSQVQNVHSLNLLKRKCISEVVRIASIIIFHLSELRKAKFFILCDVIFLVRLQKKFEIDHSWEWRVNTGPTGLCSRVMGRKILTHSKFCKFHVFESVLSSWMGTFVKKMKRPLGKQKHLTDQLAQGRGLKHDESIPSHVSSRLCSFYQSKCYSMARSL